MINDPALTRAVEGARFAASLAIGACLLLDAFVLVIGPWELGPGPVIWGILVPLKTTGFTLWFLSDIRNDYREPQDRRRPRPVGVVLHVFGKLWPMAVNTAMAVLLWSGFPALIALATGVLGGLLWWPRQARMDMVVSGEIHTVLAVPQKESQRIRFR